jgi:hypothetical protein
MLGDLNPIGSIDHDPDIPVELTDTAIVRVGCAAATGRSLSAPDVDQCTTATTATSTSTSSTTTTLACDANQCLVRGASGFCEFQCDPNNCETCVNGSCVGCDRAGCEFCNEDTHACVDGCNVEGAECTFYAGGRNGSERAACCNPALEGPICILETGDPQFPFTAVCCAPDLVCCGTLTGCCPP